MSLHDSSEGPKWKSMTTPLRPISRDKFYYNLPYYEDKPCVYVKEVFEDHRRRMYNTNIIEKIAEKLVSCGIVVENRMSYRLKDRNIERTCFIVI